MVVFVDYDDQGSYDDAHHHRPGDAGAVLHPRVLPDKSPFLSSVTLSSAHPDQFPPQGTQAGARQGDDVDATASSSEKRDRPNDNAFAAALSCYPVVKEIAKSVDLNTLDALSRTCRQFRANLLPFRHQLIKLTLRCENERIETLSDLLSEGAAIPESLKHVIRLINQGAPEARRLTSGRVGKCARDMVAECRRCSRVNCTIKPPSNAMLKNRLRRLCTTCRSAPLVYHLYPKAQIEKAPPNDPPSFTESAFARTPCNCEDAVWLCQTCGQSLRNNDTTYRRVWSWRARYSTYRGGGLGTGVGEGSQGVKCGRGEDCLAAQEIELEVVCEADESAVGSSNHSHVNGHGHHVNGYHNRGLGDSTQAGRLDNHEEEPGYFRQEIVGIGGVVKKKAKKRVMVGACVDEHEDEHKSGNYLLSEESGQHRSWCSWCWRVVPSKEDLQQLSH
ncbi:hypothetical protein T310_5106 [Rasamsonia emersonii CBS 393.64]|uniref:Uncharacterized protein n=1 Tax=Rasamsonia emersonii (strain ATCC 16479 / CBS 393.64 / IMI 116815) TaxID=1408163 RepID=A0A0F4YTB8_RASE3|nr:hypothetical protein T310_5106 [Rasamsonia emersonii CBS 393.64]KKA20868.1 hypothetical protein T310_5106 [Rasamsonia emersonii CBS 393.64]